MVMFNMSPEREAARYGGDRPQYTGEAGLNFVIGAQDKFRNRLKKARGQLFPNQ